MKYVFLKAMMLALLVLTSQATYAAKEQTVVLISIDGMRWDYIEKHGAPNLKAMAAKGVRAQKLMPVYPTKTFPNHISIITGLLPVNHGIVDNNFCDKARKNDCYSMGKGMRDSTWVNGIPLWNLAKMQGLKSATYFWPESDARFNGMTPDYYFHYSKYSEYQGRVDQIIQWLSLPKAQRPRFVASYFSLVDSMGHEFGPDAPQTRDAVKQLDELMGQLQTRLSKLEQEINLVIVSDHGMAYVNPEQSIDVSTLPKNDNFIVKNTGPRLLIYAKPAVTSEQIATYKQRLQQAANGRYTVLNDEQLAGYHYNKGTRVGDIVVQTNAPAVFTNEGKAMYLGTHGYAYTDDMAATLIAVGPAFKQGLSLEKVNNLDIYPVLAKVMGLKLLSKVDGDGKTLMPAIKQKIVVH
ncbi:MULTISPECIES: ectonucleotide pyrophosphatase/phosphodiesterase [Pseudoalteromonas]|uniref:alkaline phosphatase family protein n=1 Tax=Pseudoalteromonas TaxID=53246 RepID=UPI0002C9F850|nr:MULTISPECIES: ectonucleotide pyrophosphatase/phosphodiesterase [Pseudoalteromonas]ENN96930.1 type I phosphodiesterase/nucleotide pyrophosphatase [Pseudoalteromonas agarivorans S816]TMS64911.1 alkaline phosphatase family protein [Pseudoalteromonas sp. S1691]TMS68941.1 alkaline phosphatase family protein [Pseudoalteromonas sp. S1941]TMS71418.1 alkaline phosphatase family protein [Pseudoalteromonas sp. S1731]TMS75786.1 alkaline phosphatase family protein [Pseudoalteromonas sp. S1690]